MKLRPAYLIVCSVIIFLLNFLILANKTIFPENTIDGFLVVVIAFVCALVFISGIIWAIIKSISGKIKVVAPVTTVASTKPMSTPDKSSLTLIEIIFNRLFAFLLILSTVPYLLNIFTIPTIILFVIFGLFLWFGKKYHLFMNIIFLIFALGVYFIPLPIGWGFFRGLKEFRLNGFNFVFSVLFIIPQFIFVSFTVRNVLGNIFVYFKTSISHCFFYFVSLFAVFTIILAYPLFDSVKLRNQSFPAQGNGDLVSIVLRQSLTFKDQYHQEDSFTSRIDPSTKKYIYRLRLTKPLTNNIQFTKVEIDNEKINFTTDSRVICLSCQKDIGRPYSLVFPADKNIDFIIESNQLIRVIIFTESGDKMDEFTFWE